MNEREQRELDKLLMNSSQGVNIQQITELIEAGADVNAVNERKETPLHTAVRYGHKELVEFLLNRGANISAVERRGWTPLHVAVRYSCKELVELLLDRGANVNVVDNLDMIPLHFALKYGREELVELLLDRGANVNAIDYKRKTPLSIVASDYQIKYCDKRALVETIIAYAVVHSGITTKPECIVKNSKLSEFWDYYQNEMMNIKLGNSTVSLYQFLRETDENKLAGYLSNEESGIRSYLEKKQYEGEYPTYASMVRGQFHKAMKRKDLLDRSNIVMDHSDDLKKFSQEVKGGITNHLENEDLRNIIRAPFNVPSQNLGNPSAEQLQGASRARS